MSTVLWIAVALVAGYALAVLSLVVAGRRTEAKALATESVALVRRALTDPRVPRRWKLAIVLTLAYLACPIDLIPDFIPVAGQLDDVIVVALLLRGLRRYVTSP